MPLLLGIDIGTSSAKAVLFDSDAAAVLATAGCEYPIYRPAPDRAEQDPDDWWRAVVETVRRVTAQAGRNDVAGIGFSGQMHGVILLGPDGAPIHPAIIWADQRSASTCAAVVETVGAEQYLATTGTLPAAGFQGPTLLWLKRHLPQVLDRTRAVILPKDDVRRRMTGEIATDVSDAAGTGLFDVSRRAWAQEIIRRAGLPEAIFPRVLGSAEMAGRLTAPAAAELGLPAGIPVAAGCADQPAQATANGLSAPGRASVTTGSGGQVLVPLRPADGRVPTDGRLHVFNHAAPDTWYVLGAILSAGLSLRWLRGITGLEGRADAYPTFSAEAAQVPLGADGLIFLPYLTGERTPHMDPLARGAFVGLGAHHTRGHLARAVMEGVAFALRQALELSLKLSGPVQTVIAAGGGAESDVWRQIQADVFGLPLRKSLLVEQAGVGAALLGGVAAGVYADLDDACARTARYGPPTEPDPARHARYDELYARFQDLYLHLKDDFHWLAGFGRTDS